jgi:hypothetical protein
VGLSTAAVVASGAGLADESGIGSVSLAALAERLGVKAPTLYKHVDGVGDPQHLVADRNRRRPLMAKEDGPSPKSTRQ